MVRTKAAFVLLMILAATAGSASRRNDVVHDYFSDPKLTHWVGEIEYTCGGAIIKQGVTTAYERHTSDSCAIRKIGSARMSMIPASASRRDRLTMCYNACARKFGGVHDCTRDGCPYAEALSECDADCEANAK